MTRLEIVDSKLRQATKARRILQCDPYKHTV